MAKHLYVVWFRDSTLAASEPKHEWPACFCIDADTPAAALDWGNHLAADYQGRHPHQSILRTYIDDEIPANDLAGAPAIRAGEPADDKAIGW